MKIKTSDEINKFEIFKIKKDKYIKNNHLFSKKKIINLDKNNSQLNVLASIFDKKKSKNISKILKISYDTSKLINKIKSMQ